MNELNIHTRLKIARKELQLNQLEIANDLNIQQKTISEIENGKIINIPNTYIYYFYKKGISLEWIYDQKGAMKLIDNVIAETKTNQNMQLSELFNEVKDKKSEYPSDKNVTKGSEAIENISLYERLLDSKDVTIKSLLSYVASQENNLDFIKEFLVKRQ